MTCLSVCSSCSAPARRRQMLCVWFLVATIVLPVDVSAQTVYRTRAADGSVLYTDDPDKGGQAVNLAPVTIVPLRGAADAGLGIPAEQVTSSPSMTRPPSVGVPYDIVAITAPADGSVLPTGAAGEVSVRVAVEPPLAPRHRLRLLIDDRPMSDTPGGVEPRQLSGLSRGEHRLKLVLTDADGRLLQQSDEIRLHVQRASRLLPANPLRPAPPTIPSLPGVP
ncbi:DUF4124 domain-containing protein [Halomonas sp. V046]|uniref:DUF4124 domain-containing protein n=1 Tax=Halomonas sp. V046 TaxID=3459611 RepID=UPI0040440C94